MPGGDPEKGESRTFRSASTLLPVPKSVNANSQGLRERDLRHPQESPQQSDVISSAELTLDDAFSHSVRDRMFKVALFELWEIVAHLITPMYCRNRRASDLVAHLALMIRIVSSDHSV